MANDIIQKKEQAMQNGNHKNMQSYVKEMQGEIAKALPSVISPERFTRMVLSAISTNPKLGECTPQSFLAAMMSSAQLGLEPNTPIGQAYIIPYRNHGVIEASYQIGYKGLIDLAYRSGEIKSIFAQIVYENDKFECEFGINPILRHVPADGERGNPVKAYAIYTTVNDGYGFDVMTIDEVKEHAKKYSKAYSSGYTSPWTTNFEEMAKKTVLKKALKYAPLSAEFMREVSADETIKTTISDDMSAEPNVIDYPVLTIKSQIVEEEQTENK